MVYDCFLFNHELDLLELRLHTHADSVDKFVLVESECTLTNKPKPLYFAENRERFEAFADRIIHIVVKADTMPEGEGEAANFAREHAQRNAIGEGLVEALPDDLIMVADVDEILRPGTLKQFRGVVSVVDCAYYRHYFNLRAPELSVKKKNWLRRLIRRLTRAPSEWTGPVILRMRHFPGGQAQRDLSGSFYGPFRLSKHNPFKPLLERRNPHLIRQGGWHFHGVMAAVDLAKKISDSSHPIWQERYPDKDAAARLLADLRAEAPTRLYNSVLSEEATIQPVIERLDERFPAWLLANRERFRDRILPLPEPTR